MIPIKLSLAGFTSYREPAEIDFSGLDLVCISGSNGAGKSSLLDAITYALFGQARKRDEAIINNACQKAEVTLDFSYEGQIYRVSRSIQRGKGTQAEFFIQNPQAADPSQRWKVLTERTLSETNALIERTLRLNYETFINASFFLQGKADSFATQKPADRKKILGSILGLDQWEQYRNRTAELIREKQNEVRLRDSALLEVQAELDQEPERKARLALLEEKLKAGLAQVSEAQSQLEQKRAVELRLAEQRKMAELLSRQVEKAETDQVEIIQRLDSKQNQLDELRLELARAGEIEADYAGLMALRLQLVEADGLADKVHPFEAHMQELQTQLQVQRARLTQELQSLQDEKTGLERETARMTEMESQQVQLVQEMAALQTRVDRKELLEHELLTLQAQAAEKQAENSSLRTKTHEIKDRLTRIEKVEGAACPLCGQPLAAHDRERLEAELQAEGTSLADQFRANRDLIEVFTQRQQTLTDEKAEIQKQERSLLNLVRENDRLTHQISQLAALQAQWEQTKAPRLEQVRADLAGEQFLPEVRAQLAQIEEQLIQLGYDRAAHIRLREQVAQAQPAQDAFHHLGIAKNTVEQIELAVKELEANLEKQDLSLESLRQEHSEAAARLAVAQVGLPDIRVTEQSLAQLQEDAALLQRQVGGARQELHNLEQQRQRKSRLKSEKESLNAEIGQLRVLERSFGKDGVPAMLIEQALPELETQANEILLRLSNYTMSVSFATQRSYKDARRDDKKETLDILISDGASTRDYETFSGGEAFRVNFAIRLALSRVLSMRAGARLQTLVIDEGFGNQDSEGRQRLIEAINQVRHDFAKILVITHIEELKDEFPARIEVEKGPKGSKATVYPA
ncbi:MAG: SMC family ATPase [Anaerolineaceae bacterium]